ncbi:methionine--tRNA ligase [Mycoplasma struthionis]|uniref:Methionine--tRNA ligase n=1 Tax=Mycoplasma struthionis TaxID=538220 RepID=A0A3G8LJ33_9MOLU|nr:methionine--tRNA ligase [Mycoplasma struthionis]AZG68880.1 methionine--tRNA ligase [Mycoplasma struthionis]
MKKTFYISTPIYYPSGDLHIGHLLTTTLAWVYRNYKKQQGYKTFFVTGIDEHGEKIAKKALENNLEPLKFTDLQTEKFKNLWTLLNIDYDHFSRTTNKNHEKMVIKIFNKMLEKGYIYKGSYQGLYSVSDEEFLTLSQAKKENGKFYHPVSGHELSQISEESYFFKMSMFSNWIKDFLINNPEFISNKATQKELITNFLLEGLEDLSVTRVSFDWGIKLDNLQTEKKHVIYVWLDALFNYLSALNYLSEENDELYNEFWKNGDERVHVLGKEISRFHSLYWPIFLKSLDINMPTKEIVHSWIITPEGKMSKSKGNVINPIDLINKYGAEEIKYFFASQINIDSDYSFSEKTLINVLNANLSNNFGNLVNRVAKMINNSFENGVYYDKNNLQEIDLEILEILESYYLNYKEQMDNFHIDKANDVAMALSSKLNEYIDKTEPWKLTNDLTRLNCVLNTLLNGIYLVNLMLSIIMPIKCQKINQFIAQNSFDYNLITDFKKFDNKQINVSEILFMRIKNN